MAKLSFIIKLSITKLIFVYIFYLNVNREKVNIEVHQRKQGRSSSNNQTAEAAAPELQSAIKRATAATSPAAVATTTAAT